MNVCGTQRAGTARTSVWLEMLVTKPITIGRSDHARIQMIATALAMRAGERLPGHRVDLRNAST